MTDEEKKAFKGLVLFPYKYTLKYEDDKNIEIVRNIIINQQKEIENLKEIEEAHKEENGELRKEIDIQKEINSHLKFLYDDSCKCLVDSIPKSKIEEWKNKYNKSNMWANADDLFYFEKWVKELLESEDKYE